MKHYEDNFAHLSLPISELQPEGKRRMNFKEFLAGNSL
jgi:methionyl-tRNA formyltransferase